MGEYLGKLELSYYCTGMDIRLECIEINLRPFSGSGSYVRSGAEER